MYPFVRQTTQNTLNKDGDNFIVKAAAGGLTGALGSFIFNPIDVVRVRYQRNPNVYPSTISAFSIIYTKEGLSGMWSGGSASITRSALLSGSQLATYETFKKAVSKSLNIQDSPLLQSVASIVSGNHTYNMFGFVYLV